MTRRRPIPSAVSAALPAQQGLGLLGLIVVLALSTVVVGVAYTAYRQNEITADSKAAAASATTLGQVVKTAYASAPSFELLTNAKMTQDKLWPANVLNKDGQPVDPWGGSIQLVGTGVDSFALTYEGVDSEACPRFVSASSQGWDDVKVNGNSVLVGHKVEPAAAALLCNQSAASTVQFVGSKDLGVTSMAPLSACVPPAPQTQTIAMAGEVSSVPPYPAECLSQQRTAFCANPYALPAWGAWTSTSSTCVPVCVAPAATLTPQNQTISGSASCPGGQTGSDTWTQNQTRTQTVVHACSTPIGPVVDQAPTYSGWVNSGGHIGEVNTCTPTCATRLASAVWQPNPVTQTQTVGGSAACPSGQVGTDTWTQMQTHSRTASCANPAAAVDPAWGAWSAWANTGGRIGEVNTCAPACVVPPSQTQSVSCPAGQTGSISQRRDATCPAPTGPATWGAWYQTGSSCAPSAPPPVTCTAYVAGSGGAFTVTPGPGTGICGAHWKTRCSDGSIQGDGFTNLVGGATRVLPPEAGGITLRCAYGGVPNITSW